MGTAAGRVPVYILAGGESRRFQEPGDGATHQDKARHVVDGLPLMLHAVRAAAALASEVKVVAAHAGNYDDFGIPTLADRVPGKGPLAGLLTALEDAPPGWILALSCDWYGIHAGWLETLLDARTEDVQAVFFEDSERIQPLLAAYHSDALPTLRTRLDTDRLSLSSAVTALPHLRIPAPADWPAARNVNRLGDLD